VAWEETDKFCECGEPLILFTAPRRFLKCRICGVEIKVHILDKFLED